MIIATRLLTSRDEQQQAVEIPIAIHAPEETDGHWICRFEIGWPEGKLERYGAGKDAVQALVIALQMIGSHIYSNEHHQSGHLGWYEQGLGYGFPVANTIRDLLVGYDKQFF
jgi:hypothetical protein